MTKTRFPRSLRTLGSIVLLVAGALVAVPSAAADAPLMTLTPSHPVLTAYSPLTLTAAIDVPGATLALSRMVATEDTFVLMRTATVAANGRVSWTLRPKHSTTYRIDFAGDGQWEPASAEVAVSVRPRVRLSAPSAVYEGRRVKFTVRVDPAHPGATVGLQRRVDGVWTDWRTVALDEQSRGVSVWRTAGIKTFAFRAVAAADESHAAGKSAKVTLKVRDPNPYGVPRRPAHFIVVDKSQYKLYYHEHGRIVRIFVCVLGKASTPTPFGRFKIYAKDTDVGGPYGPRRMRYRGLYAIHGTNEPWLLKRFPRSYSHGCTRLSNANIRWLFARCAVGTPVWNVP